MFRPYVQLSAAYITGNRGNFLQGNLNQTARARVNLIQALIFFRSPLFPIQSVQHQLAKSQTNFTKYQKQDFVRRRLPPIKQQQQQQQQHIDTSTQHRKIRGRCRGRKKSFSGKGKNDTVLALELRLYLSDRQTDRREYQYALAVPGFRQNIFSCGNI